MKFIHCADVHLDTPLQGLAEYPGAPVAEIRNATRRAFEKILNAAISEKVDFVIIAGDLYDTGLKSFESALIFQQRDGAPERCRHRCLPRFMEITTLPAS